LTVVRDRLRFQWLLYRRIASANACTWLNPSPEPFPSGLVVYKGSNAVRDNLPGVMPFAGVAHREHDVLAKWSVE